ncbi:MAG: lecithin retinol acyltransferase family protein [Clostridia bacterium]|nr:lecithin retinol acyltransferase family protein [Clostridia bacterium]
MKWQLKQPVAGDMIRVKLGSIYHYGVFVSEEEVIQFGLAPSARPTLKDSDIEVCASDIDAFLCGGFLEVAEFDRAEKKKNRRSKDAVAFARENMGKRGYHILYNNCEHFAYECVTGKPYCSQTDGVRALFQSLPVVDVYVARIPEGGSVKPLTYAEREREIADVSNEKTKAEKYFVWKLLEYALERTFGKKLKKLTVIKNENGKWECPDFAFSLSHSHNAVAVALSRKALGVDIERIAAVKSGVENKILTAREKDEFSALPIEEKNRYLLEKWTQKESVFKSLNQPVFHPEHIETANEQVETQEIEIAGEKYLLTVASPDLAKRKLVFVPHEKL